jgi:hypothetical protein
MSTTNRVWWSWLAGAVIIVLQLTAGCSKEDSLEVALPVVSTLDVTGITSTTAVCGGSITSDGGSDITARGICWNTTPDPIVADYKSNDGSLGTGSYACNLYNLTGNTTYYVRAYATNSKGTAYGDTKVFSTSETSEFVTTLEATSVRCSKAILNGLVNANNLITDVYFEYGTNTSYGHVVSAIPAQATGDEVTNVSAPITGLEAVTTYHFRLRIVNTSGTAFGNDLTFFTGYVVGDTALGGVVFYTDASGLHGLVATLADQDSGMPWSNGSYVTTGATGITIGTGKSNTAAIVAVQGEGFYAAKICDDLTLNGFNDWFLPSIDELQLIHSEIGLTAYAYYWSSSELDSNNAWYGFITNLNYFGAGTESKSITAGPGMEIGTTVPYYVRAVREF